MQRGALIDHEPELGIPGVLSHIGRAYLDTVAVDALLDVATATACVDFFLDDDLIDDARVNGGAAILLGAVVSRSSGVVAVAVGNQLYTVELEAEVVEIVGVGLGEVVEVEGDGIASVLLSGDGTAGLVLGPLGGEGHGADGCPVDILSRGIMCLGTSGGGLVGTHLHRHFPRVAL